MKTLRFEGSDPSSSFNQRTLQKGLGCNGGSYKLQLQLQSRLLRFYFFKKKPASVAASQREPRNFDFDYGLKG